MRIRHAVFILCILASASLHADQPAFDAERVLSAVIAFAKKDALRSPSVDWPALEAKMRDAAVGAKDEIDLLRAFELLAEGLGDGHSYVNVPMSSRNAYLLRHGRNFDAGRTWGGPPTSPFWRRKQPEATAVKIGSHEATLLVVPSYAGDIPGGQWYADKLYAGVAARAAQSCGFIVDLRGNVGGNMWPMLAGVGMVAGNGQVLKNIDRDGNQTMAVSHADGVLYNHVGTARYPSMRVQATQQLPNLAEMPVAVLIDSAVSSSGDAVAIAFHDRPHTRFFGERTDKRASMNRPFPLQQGTLQITVGWMADRNGKVFPEGLEPDETVAFAPGADGKDDSVVEAAKTWLAKQPGCSG